MTSTAKTGPAYTSRRTGGRFGIGATGRGAIDHVQAAKDAARAERTERIKTVMAARLREIQDSQSKKRKGK
jgi:hypothetical protein